MKHSILLVDDHKIFRDALRSLIMNYPELEVIGEAGDGLEALRLASELRPDIVFMDINLPRLSGIETTKQMLVLLPEVRVIALSTYIDQAYVSDMINAGASAYVCKSEGSEELQNAIAAVIAHKKYLCASVANNMMRESFVSREIKTVTLSARERQVLQRISNGLSSLQIAHELNIATGTVDVHRRNLMRKLQLHNAVELTRYALNTGIAEN